MARSYRIGEPLPDPPWLDGPPDEPGSCEQCERVFGEREWVDEDRGKGWWASVEQSKEYDELCVDCERDSESGVIRCCVECEKWFNSEECGDRQTCDSCAEDQEG